jgi:23S rRNA (pseudouridine1915-N3)-methyltransferase
MAGLGVRLIVAAVGRPRDSALSTLVQEYERRAARYWPLEVHEVREEPARSASAEAVRAREGERLLMRVGTSRLVACDQAGDGMTSERFAAWLQRERELARDLAFVIGGAFGLAPEIRERAALRLALAPWTLPHELARLILAEQLYRAGTIVRGEPYHK